MRTPISSRASGANARDHEANGRKPRERVRALGRRSVLAVLAIIALGIATPSPVNAQSLNDLRASGAIGERYDGYVEARDPSARSFANQVNAKRRQEYESVAAKQGVSPDQVGRVFAGKIMSRVPRGTWFLTEQNRWVQN